MRVLVTFEGDVELGRPDRSAVHRRGRDRHAGEAQTAQSVSHRIERRSEVEQGPDQHVTRDPGEAIQVERGQDPPRVATTSAPVPTPSASRALPFLAATSMNPTLPV